MSFTLLSWAKHSWIELMLIGTNNSCAVHIIILKVINNPEQVWVMQHSS